MATLLAPSYNNSRLSISVSFDNSKLLLLSTLQEIAELANLPENWDGEDALPVSEEAIHVANSLITNIDSSILNNFKWRTPAVSPTPDGGIDLDWRGDQRLVITIRVKKQDSFDTEIKCSYLALIHKIKIGYGSCTLNQAIMLVNTWLLQS